MHITLCSDFNKFLGQALWLTPAVPAAVNQTKPELYHFKVRLLYTSSRTTWATYNDPVKQSKTKHFLGILRALEKIRNVYQVEYSVMKHTREENQL